MRLIPISPLVSVSYEPDGDGYWWRAYRNNRLVHGAWNHGSRRVAERDAKQWMRKEGLWP